MALDTSLLEGHANFSSPGSLELGKPSADTEPVRGVAYLARF